MPDEETHPDAGGTMQIHEIASDALGRLPACSQHCHTAIETFEAARAHLRTRLCGSIQEIVDAPVQGLAAVDGTHTLQETTGITLVLLVAVAVRGVTLSGHRTRVLVLPPVDRADMLAGDLRTRLELNLLAEQIRHDSTSLVVLDGSLISVYLTLQRLLYRHATDQRRYHPDWWSTIPDLLDRRSIVQDWLTILRSPQVIAHPKHVTTRRDIQQIAHLLPTPLRSDMVLWSTVLAPGECSHFAPLFTQPVRMTGAYWRMSEAERAAITAAHEPWSRVYARLQTARPALRLELLEQSNDALMEKLCTLRNDMGISEIMEPLPQYLADALCRGQGQVLQAMVNGMNNTLRRSWDNNLVNIWLGGWRTER